MPGNEQVGWWPRNNTRKWRDEKSGHWLIITIHVSIRVGNPPKKVMTSYLKGLDGFVFFHHQGYRRNKATDTNRVEKQGRHSPIRPWGADGVIERWKSNVWWHHEPPPHRITKRVKHKHIQERKFVPLEMREKSRCVAHNPPSSCGTQRSGGTRPALAPYPLFYFLNVSYISLFSKRDKDSRVIPNAMACSSCSLFSIFFYLFFPSFSLSFKNTTFLWTFLNVHTFLK